MPALVLSPYTRPLRIRTRLAPGRDRSAPTRLLLELHAGSRPRAAFRLECTDPGALRLLHRALGDLLADYRTYLPAAEHRYLRDDPS